MSREGALALLVNGAGEVLLQLREERPGRPYGNTWGPPGGGIEPGETREAVVRRELREEIAFEAGELAEVGCFVTPEGYVLHIFQGAIGAPSEALARNERLALRYVAPRELGQLQIAPRLKPVLREALCEGPDPHGPLALN